LLRLSRGGRLVVVAFLGAFCRRLLRRAIQISVRAYGITY